MNKGYYQKKLHSYNKSRYNVEKPTTIILVLYETALSSLRNSLMDIDNNNIEAAHKNIIKAKIIVSELNYSLNMEIGGDIAQNLKMLYNYIYNKLLDANIKKDRLAVEECIGLLKNLYEGWKIGLKGNQHDLNQTSSERVKSLNLTV